MSTILKFSEAASMAIHSMGLLALAGDSPTTTKAMAQALSVSENHLAKVLQRLAHSGLVRATRGPAGGYVLARLPQDTTILTIYESIEGPLDSGTCLLGTPVCGGNHCPLGKMVSQVYDLVSSTLGNSNLLQVTEVFRRKSHEAQSNSN
ncbi:MAG: Rrf2 family transcriptional regulator [Candidatus Brocadiia bacterium]